MPNNDATKALPPIIEIGCAFGMTRIKMVAIARQATAPNVANIGKALSLPAVPIHEAGSVIASKPTNPMIKPTNFWREI
jgi:hypothetical protein